MSKIRIPKQVFDRIKDFAQQRGIPVDDAVKMFIEASRARAIGASAVDYEMPDPPTFMSTGEGHMPQIEGRLQHEPDDFEEFAQRREEMLQQAGGDELGREILMRQHQTAELNQQANFVRHAPISAVGQQLGSTQNVAPGETKQVARWDGVDDSEAQAVTVVLGPVRALPPPQGTGVNTIPFATILWGNRGTLQQADIDIGRGCQLTVTASSVQVLVGLEDNAANGTLDLTGMISFGTCVRTLPLTRSVYIADLKAGTSNTKIDVPAFAKRVTLMRVNPTVDVSLTLLDYSFSGAYGVDFAATAGGFETLPLNYVDLTGDIAHIQVSNNGAADTMVRLLFELDL